MQAVNGIGEQCHQYFSSSVKKTQCSGPQYFLTCQRPLGRVCHFGVQYLPGAATLTQTSREKLMCYEEETGLMAGSLGRLKCGKQEPAQETVSCLLKASLALRSIM